MSSTYEKAQNYTNIIIRLGYAGFFGIWNLIPPNTLKNWDRKWSITGIIISLLFFILWKVGKMISNAIETKRNSGYLKELTAENITQRTTKYQKAVNEHSILIHKIWIFPVLPLTILPDSILTSSPYLKTHSS